MRKEMVSFCLVCYNNMFHYYLILRKASGFSRGAYQVRILSAMIDKVCHVLRCLAVRPISLGKYRLASFIRATRCRYHCESTFEALVHCLISFSAFELYADLESDEPTVTQVGQVDSPGEMSMAKRFKSAFSHKDVKVHFVGAWCMVHSLLVWMC